MSTSAIPHSGTWRDRLASEVARSGRSKRDISLSAGLSQNYLREILEAGKEPSFTNLVAIAGELGLKVADLTDEQNLGGAA